MWLLCFLVGLVHCHILPSLIESGVLSNKIVERNSPYFTIFLNLPNKFSFSLLEYFQIAEQSKNCLMKILWHSGPFDQAYKVSMYLFLYLRKLMLLVFGGKFFYIIFLFVLNSFILDSVLFSLSQDFDLFTVSPLLMPFFNMSLLMFLSFKTNILSSVSLALSLSPR